MGISNRYTLKTITVFHVAFFFSLLLVHSANAIPTAEDINSLSEKALQTTDTFIQKSFQLRMAYQYSGKFLNNRDKEKLHVLAKTAGDKLLAISDSQRKIKQQIEDYQGNDWDERYGSTGLWRKLAAGLYATNEYKCQIDFYLALTTSQVQRNIILHKILTQLDSLNTAHLSAESQLLKAEIYSLLSQTDSSYKQLAKKEFDLLMVRSDMKHSTAFRIAIERIILFGPTVPDQLNTLAENIAKSRCKDNIELVLSLAFLQRRYEPESLKQTVQIWPQIEDFLGSLVLSDLSNHVKENRLTKQYLQQLSVCEADLAAQAAWKNKTQEYKMLLGHLSDEEKFQTPLILYVTAIATADSLPAEAVNLLIKASLVQQLQKSDRLNIEACELAKQAARLAYNLYTQNTDNCRLATEAFENYYTMAVEKIDEKLEYFYTTILGDCGHTEKRKILLEKIANRPAGSWRKRAKLDLIKTAIRQHQSENPEKISLILKQLDTFIKELRLSNKDNKLRAEAIKTYCRLIFQSKQIASARKVLDVITDSDIAVDPNLNIPKANAQRKLGKLDEAAESLCKVVNSSSDKYTHAIQLLLEFIDKLDYYQAKFDGFPKIVRDCYKLACYCWDYAGSEDSRRVALMLTEISVLVPEEEQSKSTAARELVNSLAKQGDINDIDLLRCRARLLTTKGKFTEAAPLWAQLAKIQKNKSRQTNQQSRQWWRAKFYELDCFAKIPQTDNRAILHTIEVLENSYTNIPPLWAEKLNLLKQKCR